MEVGAIIQFEGRDYRAVQRFFRSKGGRRQQLSETPPRRVETRRAYYVVENAQAERFWVKEYTDPAFGEGAQSEYAELSKLATPTVYKGHDIRAVHVFAVSGSRILMELLHDYTPLTHLRLAKDTRILVRSLLIAWLREHPGVDISHDFGAANVLLKQGKQVSVRLVDFEVVSNYDNRKRWSFL